MTSIEEDAGLADPAIVCENYAPPAAGSPYEVHTFLLRFSYGGSRRRADEEEAYGARGSVSKVEIAMFTSSVQRHSD